MKIKIIRALVLATLITLSATPASADTVTFFSGLFGGFNRPDAGTPPTTLSGITVPFNAQMFTVSISGSYSFTLTADFNDFAPFLVLYENSFDPLAPLTNALFAGGGFTFNLTAGTTYIIVPTAVTGSVGTGAFHATISGPGAINPVGGVVIPEPATIVLLATGLSGVVLKIRRRYKRENKVAG